MYFQKIIVYKIPPGGGGGGSLASSRPIYTGIIIEFWSCLLTLLLHWLNNFLFGVPYVQSKTFVAFYDAI